MWRSQKEKIRNKVHEGNIIPYVRSTKISSNSVKLKEKWWPFPWHIYFQSIDHVIIENTSSEFSFVYLKNDI